MQPSVRFFMDESGHSGSNLFDPGQPVFSVGVVALNDPSQLLPFFEETARKLTGVRSSLELKSSVLLGSARGRRELRRLYGEIARHSLGVQFVIIEKRCFVAHALVTFFLDPDYTPNLREGWADGEAIHEATQAVYKHFPTELLKDFAHGFYDCNVERLKKVRDRSIEIVNTFPESDKGILPLVSGITDTILKDEVANRWAATPARKNQVASPNTQGFLSAFGLIARHAIRFGIQRPQIVHDSQVEYEPVLRGVLALMRLGPDGLVDYGKGAPMASGAAANIDLSFEDSARSTGLVAADLIAGMVRWAATKTLPSMEQVSCKDQSESALLSVHKLLPGPVASMARVNIDDHQV